MKGGRWILGVAVVVASVVLVIRLSRRTDSEDQLAWKEFAFLVHPEAGDTRDPEWVSWATKCDVRLSSACTDRKSAGGSDRAAAEIPRQVLDEFAIQPQDKQDQFVLNFAGTPELAGVLYNSIAKESIVNQSKLYDAQTLNGVIYQLDSENVSGAMRHLPRGSFAPGSEIVKLIWEIIPDTDGQELRLYDPVSPSIRDETTLEPIIGWSARYRIDQDATKGCPELRTYGSRQNPQTVPISCFPSFSIDQKNPCTTLSKEVQFVWGCDSGPMRGHRFLVFLVGFHIMKLTPENPDWVWATYFWTRETNEAESGYNWRTPWNHFHQMTTTAIREDARPPHDICSNPYLEGHLDNGRKANCLSCHSFAAYAPNVNKLIPGVTFGGEFPYSKEKRLHDEQDYFRGAVQTSFVWSISTSQNKPDGGPDRTSFQNMLRNTLQEQFQSK